MSPRLESIYPPRPLTVRAPRPAHTARLDQDRWPLWAQAVALLKDAADSGVGDTVERYARKLGGVQFKAMSAAVGLPCRCAERRAHWNVIYPYR